MARSLGRRDRAPGYNEYLYGFGLHAPNPLATKALFGIAYRHEARKHGS